jgi:hypothetical protein
VRTDRTVVGIDAPPHVRGADEHDELAEAVGVGDHVDPGDRVARDGDGPASTFSASDAGTGRREWDSNPR